MLAELSYMQKRGGEWREHETAECLGLQSYVSIYYLSQMDSESGCSQSKSQKCFLRHEM